ncbi:MAG: 2-furoate---CoA ligase [Alphaproteobacteria bacterium]|jgi:2-furoate---CoA ligase
MQTVWDHVRLAAARTPDHPAIVDDLSDRQLSFAELSAEAETMAAGFAAAGIAPGHRVATMLPNVLEHAVAILALHRLGAVVCMINPRLKPDEAAALVADGEVTALVCPAEDDIVAAARGALPPGAPLFTHGGVIGDTQDLAACRADGASLAPWQTPAADELAFVMYTSGTTGLPKGVMIPHGATDGRVLFVPVQCGLRHGTHNRALGLMPLFHAVGFYAAFVTTLSMNGTYYVQSVFDPAASVAAIRDHKITYLFGAPAHFHAILAVPGFDGAAASTVETLAYAGSVMPGPLLERVGTSFPAARITNIYGTTETMNALYLSNPVGWPTRYRPGFYSNVRVGKIGGSVDDICADGDEGELLVDATADATFLGYLNRPDVTAEKLVDGWYWTGDIVARREDGDFDLRGRVDDMVVSGGENIHPEEIETVLMQHEAVREAAIIGMPDDQWTERVVACVVAAGIDAAALDAWCQNSALANYKRPRDYVFLDALPRNAANKVLRRELKDIAAGVVKK